MMISTVIFDLDGTLLNTLEDLADAVNYSLRKYDQPERTVNEVRQMVGNGVYVLMERALKDGKNNHVYEDALRDFQLYYKEHMLDKTKPYDGILEMLGQLKEYGYKMAIVSNKFDLAVKGLSNDFFADYIDVAIGEREELGIKKKPAPDTVFEAMRIMGSVKDECIYVGDSEVDLQTAQNAGLQCISVNWGFKDNDFLQKSGAKSIVSSPEELISVIRSR